MRGLRVSRTTASEFDGPRFARWLRRWREAEGLEIKDIAARGDLSASTVQLFASGEPPSAGRKRGQTAIDPRVNSLSRLAKGLDLELSYVLTKAGLLDDHQGRWRNFTGEERAAIARALNLAMSQAHYFTSTPVAQLLAAELSEQVSSINNTHNDQEVIG